MQTVFHRLIGGGGWGVGGRKYLVGGRGGKISYNILTPGQVGIAFGSIKTKAL